MGILLPKLHDSYKKVSVIIHIDLVGGYKTCHIHQSLYICPQMKSLFLNPRLPNAIFVAEYTHGHILCIHKIVGSCKIGKEERHFRKLSIQSLDLSKHVNEKASGFLHTKSLIKRLILYSSSGLMSLQCIDNSDLRFSWKTTFIQFIRSF